MPILSKQHHNTWVLWARAYSGMPIEKVEQTRPTALSLVSAASESTCAFPPLHQSIAVQLLGVCFVQTFCLFAGDPVL